MWGRLWKWATRFRPCSHEGCPNRATGIAFRARLAPGPVGDEVRAKMRDELKRARASGYIVTTTTLRAPSGPPGTVIVAESVPVHYCPDHLQVYRENHSRD